MAYVLKGGRFHPEPRTYDCPLCGAKDIRLPEFYSQRDRVVVGSDGTVRVEIETDHACPKTGGHRLIFADEMQP